MMLIRIKWNDVDANSPRNVETIATRTNDSLLSVRLKIAKCIVDVVVLLTFGQGKKNLLQIELALN